MFNDDEFEAGVEFTSNFISNIHSKLFLPESTILGLGDEFKNLYMV